MVISIRCFLLGVPLFFLLGACKAEKPVEIKKPRPTVIVKPKHALLTAEQRAELAFPEELIAKIELGAAAEAEPFFVTVLMHTENLKGEKGFESRKLAGLSVHTGKADELIDSNRSWLRKRGFLIFKSQKGYGRLQDVVTIVRGNNSYDILKIQGTEAPYRQLDTKSIISWLKARQHEVSFVITGAGTDWIEARFIKPPRNMPAFAEHVAAFASDVLGQDPPDVEKLAKRMYRDNGFYMGWD
ncbi:MAG TPA: DUF4253 domain-containing protein [Nitrospirota bacterium]|nr:DUF4253 domain-containing protein [Nitrospirota bacterium]